MNQGRNLFETKEEITMQAVSECKMKSVPSGTVLFSFKLSIGKIGITQRELYTNEAIAALAIKDTKTLCAEYLTYALSQIDATRTTDRAVMGATLNKKKLAELTIPLPPILEQKRIAALLDKADSIRRKRQQAIELSDQLLLSVFLDMFGDPARNTKKWPVSTLGELTSDWRGGASIKPGEFTDSGFPVLHKGAIGRGGSIHFDARKKLFTAPEYAQLKSGAVVDRSFLAVTLRDLVPTGPSIGLIVDLACAERDQYLLAQGAYGFRIDESKICPSYLVVLSNIEYFRHVIRKYAVGSTQIHIRAPVYRDLKIPVPPKHLLNKFESFVAQTRNYRVRSANAKALDIQLAQSISSAAFSGRLEK